MAVKVMRQLTICFPDRDAPLYEWLVSQGRGSASRILREALREYMERRGIKPSQKAEKGGDHAED